MLRDEEYDTAEERTEFKIFWPTRASRFRARSHGTIIRIDRYRRNMHANTIAIDAPLTSAVISHF
jgi:hypothetical protein